MLFQLSLCFIGIFTSYLISGYAIEHLTTTFGKDIFTFNLVMILTPSVCNWIFGKILIFSSDENIEDDPIPRTFYFLCSLFQMCSMACSNSALAYISYPTQLIMKSSKPIVILGSGLICLSKGIHHPSRIVSTLVIVFGVMGFMHQQYSMKDSSTKDSDVKFFNHVFGWMLVIVSLIFDSLLGVIQDKRRLTHVLNTNFMIYRINMYSCAILITGIIFTSEFVAFFKFFTANPSVVLFLLLIGVTAAIGQCFILYTVTHFGPLTCSIITNFRKFVQIFLSVALFQHALSPQMGVFVMVVFLGLMLDVWSQFKYRPKAKSSLIV